MAKTWTDEDLKVAHERQQGSTRQWTHLVLVGRRSDGAKFYVTIPFDVPGATNLRLWDDIPPAVKADLGNGLLTLDTFRECECMAGARGDDRCAYHRMLNIDKTTPMEAASRFDFEEPRGDE